MSTGATGGPADHDGERLLAVDIGGTKMAAAIVTADGTILDRRQRPTVGHDSADAMFAGLVAVLDDLAWRSTPAVAVGVGSGGPMTAGGERVSPVNIPAWRGFPLRARLAELTGAARLRRQRRQSVGARRGMEGRGRRCPGLHRHGRVDGRGWRDRARRPIARRRAGQRRPYRSRDRRT